MLAGRAAIAIAIAERLDTTPVTFPGGHDGFLRDPGAFAGVLRAVLDG